MATPQRLLDTTPSSYTCENAGLTRQSFDGFSGTYRVGEIFISRHTLAKTFGYPTHPDDHKVNFEWSLVFTNTQHPPAQKFVTIYDWKAPINNARDPMGWSVGGHDSSAPLYLWEYLSHAGHRITVRETTVSGQIASTKLIHDPRI